jgi:integrase
VKKAKEWPPKLPAGCPLSLHPKGYRGPIGGKTRWVCGKLPIKEALRVYHDKAGAYLAAGPAARPVPRREDMPAGAVVTVRYVLGRWVNLRQADADAGKIGGDVFGRYKTGLKRVAEVVGHLPTDDWTPDTTRHLYDECVRRWGEDFAKRALDFVRFAFRHAADHDWCRPVRLGSLRRLVGRGTPRMKWKLPTPEDVRTILAELDRLIAKGDGRRLPTLHQLRAMILLTLNGGFGSAELSELHKEQIDVFGLLLVHGRGKTDGTEHVTPLWPETVRALLPVLLQRPGDSLLFRTREGNPWYRRAPLIRGGHVASAVHHDNYLWQYNKLVKPLGLKVGGQGPYKFKHLANTVADAAGDFPATFTLFGHSGGLPGGMGVKAFYVGHDAERLRKVTDYMRHVLLSL